MKEIPLQLMKRFYEHRLGVAEHREFAILNCALGIIGQRGTEACTFTVIAKKCRVSRTLIHHYFRDRTALFLRLLDFATLDLKIYVETELARAGALPIEIFSAYCRATLDWPVDRHKFATTLLTLLQLSVHDAEIRKRNDSLSAAGKQTIALLLSQMTQDKNGDSSFKVASIQSLLTGACLNMLIEDLNEKESFALRRGCLRACVVLAGAS